MKGCKAWQIIFGIMCTLMTIVLGTVTLLLFLPYVGGELSSGFFRRMLEGVESVASTVGLADYAWAVLCVVFVLPTVLLGIATNLLLYGKRGGSIIAGSVLALVALVIVGGVTGVFSKTLFQHWQKLYLLLLCGGTAVFMLVFVLTTKAVKRAKAKAVAIGDDGADEIIITVEEDGDVDDDGSQDVVVETDQPTADQTTDDGILFMASDYSSVSKIADSTYEPNEVLPRKVLEKLKIARDLYEKGALTKEEYLAIVNKYLTQQ